MDSGAIGDRRCGAVCHKPVMPIGTGFLDACNRYIDTHEGVEVLLNTKAEEITVASGEPDAFGRTLYEPRSSTPPFYAAARIPTVHHTMGGVRINQYTQVLNENGQIIPGLYAAGEVTGGIHGANRLGGNALNDTVVFDRIAGENAAAAK